MLKDPTRWIRIQMVGNYRTNKPISLAAAAAARKKRYRWRDNYGRKPKA